MTEHLPTRRPAPLPTAAIWFLGAAIAAGAVVAGAWLREAPRRALAVAAAVEESFAVCTAPVGDGMEGLFLLDFETGDVAGGVLNQNTSKFTVGYRYNVLKDLGFKAGKVKNPKFLLVPGQVNFILLDVVRPRGGGDKAP